MAESDLNRTTSADSCEEAHPGACTTFHIHEIQGCVPQLAGRVRSDKRRRRSRGYARLFLAGGTIAVGILCCGANASHTVVARSGHIELRDSGTLLKQPVALIGDWEFYWDQLLSAQDFATSNLPKLTGYLRLPAAWNGSASGFGKAPGTGVATFRLWVSGLPKNQELALFLPEQATAYRLWFNGALVAANGVPARVRTHPDPRPNARLVRVTSRTGDAELILQVANHHTARGGPIRAIDLGLAEQLEMRWLRLRYLDALLLGSLLVMALYHLGLFRLRRREHTSLYIAVTSLAFALRIPFHGLSGRPIVDLVGAIPWELPQRLQAALTVWGVAAIPMYLASLIRDRTWRAVLKYAALLYALLGVAVLAVSRTTSTSSQAAGLGAHLAMSTLLLFVTVREMRRGTSAALQMLLGWAFLAPLGFAEMVLSSPGGMGTSLPLMPLGVFLFLLSHSWLAAFRLDATFTAVESLSTELRHKNRELTRMEKLKDEFLANTSHELRTPLHGMVGLAESLLREVAGPIPERARESLRLVIACGRRLTSLIDDILDLTRLRRGDIQLRVHGVDLHTLTTAVLALLEPVAREKQLVLVNSVSDTTPVVLGDEDRLHQILVNLVHNAIKFTNAGTIEVAAADNGRFVSWTVRDSGTEIQADPLESIFEQKAGDGSGLGLGLNIVRQLVRLHRGSLSMEACPSGGTIITVRLPKCSTTCEVTSREKVTSCPAEPSAAWIERTAFETGSSAAIKTEREGPNSLSGARVLLVDDDPINLRVASERLRLAGAIVSTAQSGVEALRDVARSPEAVDLVLLDVIMPGMSGYQVTERLRSTHDALSLPVVLLTARAQAEDLALGFAVGANDYLSKPFTDIELIARCRLHWNLKRTFQAAQRALTLECELEQQRHQTERASLCAVTAELEKLRYQVNPHLLFNTLASIRGAMRSNGVAAREMISLLAEYYRTTLTTGSREVVTLHEELRMTELYLAIERTRQQRPESVEWEVENAAKDYLVPTLILQPIVENAVKYGRRNTPQRPIRICIAARLSPEGELVLKVSNVGTWQDGASSSAGSTSIGLRNVRQRLAHHYETGAKLEHVALEGWVHITLTLPHPTRDSHAGMTMTHGING